MPSYVSKFFTELKAKEKALKELGFVARNCLRCKRAFKSEGAHNRICNDCKNSNSFKDTVDDSPYGVTTNRR